MFTKPRVYLDYAAATPLHKRAFEEMKPYLIERYGNASAIHKEGVKAREAVEAARERVGRTLQVKPEYVTFTGGGTESNNLAIIGCTEQLIDAGRTYGELEVITTRTEHPSVLNTMKALERRGVTVKYVSVDERGMVVQSELRQLLSHKTVLFSCAYANSEIGTVQDVRGIKKVLAEAEQKYGTSVMFHLDAAQAPLWLSCQFDSLHVDLLSLDVGKCNGPKGIGILVRSRRATVLPTVFGGGQESGLRPGTENVAGIIGASVALEEAQTHFKDRAAKVAAVRDKGIELLLSVPDTYLNGAKGEHRLANNINISLIGVDTEYATIVLDTHGFAASTKSACAGAGGGKSVVVHEVTGDLARATSTLRLSLSPETTVKQLAEVAGVLRRHAEKMRGLTGE
ncbi:MAG TPA: cysteine desulfurase family protein [Candidatus Paceibacterota bacterium]